MSFKVIDIIFIVVILILGFNGLKKGFFPQLITIIGILVGLFCAYFYCDDLAPYISKIIGERDMNTLISFILIFVVILLLSMLLNKMLKETLSDLGAEGVDKVLGLFFGLIQGVFICIVITLLLTVQPLFNPEPIFTDSLIGSKFLKVIPQIEEILPEAQDFLDNLETEV